MPLACFAAIGNVSTHPTCQGESTEKVKPTFRLKVNNGEIVVFPFFFCLS